MTLEQLREDLGKALPPTHPFLEKFDKYIGLVPQENQELESMTEVEAEAQLQRILDALEDWQRGIYDWSDIEEQIRLARATLS